jgi:hypothetical protein
MDCTVRGETVSSAYLIKTKAVPQAKETYKRAAMLANNFDSPLFQEFDYWHYRIKDNNIGLRVKQVNTSINYL